MLANALVCATLPTTDLERAKRFYGETLGLPEADFGVEGGVFYTAGAGTMFRVYERPPSTAEHTVAVFLVEDLGRRFWFGLVATSRRRFSTHQPLQLTLREDGYRVRPSPKEVEAWPSNGA